MGTHVFYDTFEFPGIGTHEFTTLLEHDTFEAAVIGTDVFYDTLKLQG